MTQNYTILFDLDGTLVDTALDLMNAHNHVMKKYGYPAKSTADIRNLVGQGADAMIGRSIWGQAKKEFGKIDDQKITKLRKICSRCGKGVFMSEHKNRRTCGKCGLTEFSQ